MASTKSNSDFTTLIAAVPATLGGPLTRKTDIPNTDPNVDAKGEFETIDGIRVRLSYNDFIDGRYVRILEEANAQRGVNRTTSAKLLAVLEVAYRQLVEYGGTPTDEELEHIYDILATDASMVALAPNRSDMPRDITKAGFTVTDGGSKKATVTNTATGRIEAIMYDWGDGDYTFSTDDTVEHTYQTNGSKTVRQVVIGKGGNVELSKSVTLA